MATKTNKQSDMPPTEIRIALIRSGVSQATIARKLIVDPSAVCRIIDGTGVSDRVRREIAAAIGIDIKRIWPSTYLYSSPRKPGRPKSY